VPTDARFQIAFKVYGKVQVRFNSMVGAGFWKHTMQERSQ